MDFAQCLCDANLQTAGGRWGIKHIAYTKINVLNNSQAIDKLASGAGRDWYFRAIDDVITDLLADESLDVL